MSKPIHYLLVGLPCSGKSTLASELVAQGKFAHINIDQLKWDKGYKDVGDDDVPDNVWKEIFNEADSLLRKYLDQGLSVANEYAWITRVWRDRARAIATEIGVQTVVIYIKIPVATVMKRWKENEITRKRFHWPEKEMQDILHDFEEPSEDENIILFDQPISVKDWIEKNLDLQGQTLQG